MSAHGRPQLVIAFPGGKGTQGMMALARGAGVEVIDLGQGSSRSFRPREISRRGMLKTNRGCHLRDSGGAVYSMLADMGADVLPITPHPVEHGAECRL